MTDKRTNQELRDLLAASGKVMTANERQRLADYQEAETGAIIKNYQRTQPAEHIEKELNGFERGLLAIPSVAEFIGDVGDTLTVLAQAIIPSLLPLLLILLIYAEAERVRYGVLLFEVHGYLATLVSYILVFGNAFLELAIQHRHSESDYERSTGYQFSFRILAQRAAYVFGIGDTWQPEPKSPALRLERLQQWLTASILFLAIGGSMSATIQQTVGNWRQGLRTILIDSSLLELLTWLSGLVSAIVIVLLAQAIVAYSYKRAGEFYHDLLERKADASSNANPQYQQWETERAQAINDARERVERDVLLKLLQKQAVAVNPIQVPDPITHSPNGNGTQS